MAMRIVIACGGTGGHLFPGIAVAEALRKRGGESLVLISEKEIDALAIRGHDDFCFKTVPAMAMPKLFSPKMIPFSLRFLRTLRYCNRMISEFGADAVLGMGGFTSLAPLLVWFSLETQILAHTKLRSRLRSVRQNAADQLNLQPLTAHRALPLATFKKF